MATMYNPPHLGELIRESVEAEGWSVTETARRLGIGRVALSRVLNGHAGVSAALALALERIGWSDAEHWMRMQAIYDLAQERRKQAGAAACLPCETLSLSRRRSTGLLCCLRWRVSCSTNHERRKVATYGATGR